MTSENTTGRLVVPAPANTPCGWWAYGETGHKLTCASGRLAVHVLTSTLPVATEGTALCGFHSPCDVTEADKYATWVDGMAADPGVEIIDGEPYGKVSGLPIFRNQADDTPGILARHRARKAAEAVAEADRPVFDEGNPATWSVLPAGYRWASNGFCAEGEEHLISPDGRDVSEALYRRREADRNAVEVAEAEVSGMDTLADMLTLDTPAEVSAVRTPASLVKFHKMTAPMVSVLLAVGALRGRADAWHMRNVIIHGATGATRATVKALIKRDMLAEVHSEDNTPGTSLTFYVVTERGAEILAALGCPMTFLPTDQAEADEYVRKAAVRPGDCSDGCDVVTARSLPVGGTVCLGCGCTFTRSGEDTHPGTLAVSEAVVRRNGRVRGY